MIQNAVSRALEMYRSAYSGHPREVWALAVLTFINRVGTMVLPFLSVYLTTVLHFSLQQAGLLSGAFGVGSLAGSYLGGRLADRLGAGVVIGVSLVLGGTMLILLQFATGFYTLFTLILLAALLGEAYRPAVSASVGAHVSKTETGRSMALIRLAINLGMSASPAIGGFVAIALGYRWLFWMDGLTCIAAAIYWGISSHYRKRRIREAGSATAPPRATREPGLPPQRNSRYLFFLTATMLLGFGFVQWFHTVPVFIKREWGYDERYIGILMALSSLLIALVEMPLIHAIEQSGKVRPVVMAGLLLIGASFLPFLLPGALFWFSFATLLLTVGEIFFLPLTNSMALNMSPADRKGEYMAWYWMAWSVANITAPIIGFGLAATIGFPAFWVIVVLLCCLSGWMNLLMGKWKPASGS